MTHVRFTCRPGGGHVHVDVRMATRHDRTHDLNGSLSMTIREFRDWREAWAWSVNRGEAAFIDARTDEVIKERQWPE